VKSSTFETVFLVVFLIGTLYLGGYTLYQINTTDFLSITKQLQGVSK
jgi:hypothetical protein